MAGVHTVREQLKRLKEQEHHLLSFASQHFSILPNSLSSSGKNNPKRHEMALNCIALC